MRQQPDYPITGIGLEVHNVFLSHAAELGLPGLLLWLLAFGGALWHAFYPFPWSRGRRRPGSSRAPPEDWRWRDPWRMGGVAIVLCFLVIANLAPFSEALPNTLLWTWLGVLAMPYTSRLPCARLRPRWSRSRPARPGSARTGAAAPRDAVTSGSSRRRVNIRGSRVGRWSFLAGTAVLVGSAVGACGGKHEAASPPSTTQPPSTSTSAHPATPTTEAFRRARHCPSRDIVAEEHLFRAGRRQLALAVGLVQVRR